MILSECSAVRNITANKMSKYFRRLMLWDGRYEELCGGVGNSLEKSPLKPRRKRKWPVRTPARMGMLSRKLEYC